LCPPVSDTPTFPYAVNVIDFGDGGISGVFGSTAVPFFIAPGGATAGNVKLTLADPAAIQQLPGGTDADGNTVTLLGLPVTGFMAYNVINASAQPGLLANYSGVFANRATALCAGSSTSCPTIITSSSSP
jgi:hypothetical protein